jgi:hypothetical protein
MNIRFHHIVTRESVPLAEWSPPQGSRLEQTDIDMRAKYNLSDDSPPDGVLSAQEMVWNNPGQGSSWHYNDFPVVPFVAQTTIASSYGLLQIWWATAYQPMNWNNGRAGRPSELIDLK